MVYPEGSGRFGRRILTWNAGGCCGFAQEQRVDDVGFTRAMLSFLVARLPVDRTRVYATGHSNGAMMAYRVAAESAERIAAIAPVAGAMQIARFDPERPVPVLHVHSVDDPRAPYEGGLGPRFPFTNQRVDHRAVETELGLWIRHNRCPGEAEVAETRRGAPRPEGEPHSATKLVFAPCETGAEVALWRLTGAGHGWPGGAAPLPERLVGPDTGVIDAAEEAWRFLRRFRRENPPRV